MLWNDHQPSTPAPTRNNRADSIQPGLISMRFSRAVREKAARVGASSRTSPTRTMVSS